MKKRILLAALAALLVLASCATSVGIEYQTPSNLNMSSYRSVAIASTPEYKGSQRSIPLYLRFDISDSTIKKYVIYSTFTYDNVCRNASTEVTNMVKGVFSGSSYYTVMSPEKTDTYLSFYKIGKNPSELLKNDGVDALIVPKITRFFNDEFVTAEKYKDKDGIERIRYILHRSIDIAVSITVLDTATDRIIASREYSAAKSWTEVYNPESPTIFSYTQSQIVSRAISDMVSDLVADFVPTSGRSYMDLKSNKPKLESVEAAYEAVKGGNYTYAYNLFNEAWLYGGHIPSGYNAALIIAARGDVDGALSYLEKMRTKVNDYDVNRLYQRLSTIKENNDKAALQYSSSSSSPVTENNSIYDFLLN